MVALKIGFQISKVMKMSENLLVGYVRRSNVDAALKISINQDAFKDCEIYTTSDGQRYVALVMSISAIGKIIDGERAVTTISQVRDD